MGTRLTIFHLDDGRGFRGGERQLLCLVKELERLGHDNVVVCRKDSLLHRAALRRNFRVLTLPYLVEWDPVSAFMLRGALKALPAGGPPPVFHSHTGHTAALAWLASAGLYCVRVAHRRVDFIPGFFTARCKYANAHSVIAVSRAIRDILLKRGVPEKIITVINDAVDPDETPWAPAGPQAYHAAARAELAGELALPREAFWIGSLIALVPHKDPENLIRSAAEVLKRAPGTIYLLAGEGPLRGRAEGLAAKLGIQDRFFFLGQRNDPYKLLAALDLFVLASREEGMGSVLVEAMNAALPIAATTAGGIPDVIKDGVNGLTVPPCDPAALAAAQLRLIEDPCLRARLAGEGYRRRKEFSSKIMADLTLNCYRAAMRELGALDASGMPPR